MITLEREVNALRTRAHRHIVEVLDADVAAGWFVMPFYRLGTLEAYLKGRNAPFRGRPLEALRAVRPLVDAVADLHVEGMVHRDIKSANIFVADHGWVLGDFGLTFDPDAEGERLTSTHESVGTRYWQAPWTRGDPSPVDDVPALGKLIWVLVSGQPVPPWVTDEEHALARLFPGDAGMVIVDAPLARCMVAEQAACVPSAVDLLGAVDDLIGIFRRGGPTPTPVRRPLPEEWREELVHALAESQSLPEPTIRTREALKDLASMAPWTAIESSRRARALSDSRTRALNTFTAP